MCRRTRWWSARWSTRVGLTGWISADHPRMRLGVCVSGHGTNLRNLVERGFEIVAVATNKTSCGGAAFARENGLPLGEFSQKRFETAEARDVAMRDFFNIQRVELVVDAGYDRVHTAPFV